MVQSMMYCSEQISIPETLPNILKAYAKAVIRTQPYDLLRWSAAYFRCLAMNVPPPAKSRLEKDVCDGSITKGFLKVLLDQVGKGFYICREVLQKRWEDLCLPEEELLKYLSVCRMVNWPQVHWLKLFAVMVGSLNETPQDTLVMLCELLTTDVEGGLARVPIWTFRVCYTFLAELDCSEEQHFVNGRKKLSSGNLEDEIHMDDIPMVFGAKNFQNDIINECRNLIYSDQLQGNEPPPSLNESEKSDCQLSTSLSESFEGKYGKIDEILKHADEFDSLIVLLREVNDGKLHEYEAPQELIDNNLEHVKQREADIFEARQNEQLMGEKQQAKFIQDDILNALKELGPPWSFIHQFTADSCRNQSYNFIEQQSIVSDLTPTQSSHESFDFENNRPLDIMGSETEVKSMDPDSTNIESVLNEEKLQRKDFMCTESWEHIGNLLKKAETDGEVDITDTSSVISYLHKDEMEVLERAGEKTSNTFNIDALVDILKSAKYNNKSFESVEDLIKYIKTELSKILNIVDEAVEDHRISSSLQNEEKKARALQPENGFRDGEDGNNKEWKIPENSEEPEKTPQIIDGIYTYPDEAEAIEQEKDENIETKNIDTGDDDDVEDKEKSKTRPKSAKMNRIFDASGVELCIEGKGFKSQSSDDMILGVIGTSKISENVEAEIDKESLISMSVGNISAGGNVSDVSSKFSPTSIDTGRNEKCVRSVEYICGTQLEKDDISSLKTPPEYFCTVPVYPGIGPAVTKKTIQDFLTYLKFRSTSQKGMVMPRNFKEEKCPNMLD